MNKNFQCVLLVGLMLVLASQSYGTSTAFEISGEYIAIDSDSEPQFVQQDSDTQEVDLSNATIILTYETFNENGESEVVELGEGHFVENEVTIEGQIDTPTEVDIAVQVNGEEQLSTRFFLSPGDEEVSFVLLDRQGAFPPDQLLLVGAYRGGEDPSKKFTVAGDLRAVENFDLSLAVASVEGMEYDDNGNLRESTPFGSVLLRDGQFVIEAEVDRVTAVTIKVDAGFGWEFLSFTPAVIEPNIKIEVFSHAVPGTLIAKSGTGMHVELVESWQQSDEYLTTMNQYLAAWQKELGTQDNLDEFETDSPPLSDEDSQSTDRLVFDSSTERTESEEESINKSAAKQEDAISASNETAGLTNESTDGRAKGCEHVPIVEAELSFEDEMMALLSKYKYSESALLGQEMKKIREDALDRIARDTTAPLNSLLALELGAFTGFGRDDQHLALPVFDKLAKLLDEDTVDRRILPPRNAIAQRLAVEANDEKLIPGQKAPDFNLPTLDGTQLALYEVLEDKEVVLVDFWASWCGPCIATFPDLKELYSSFGSDGFEIIVISIDDTFEEWQQASQEHDLPWLSVADIGGFGEKTPINYGVDFIPKGYFIDSKGCILQKNMKVETLRDMLEARFGGMPDLDKTGEKAATEVDLEL